VAVGKRSGGGEEVRLAPASDGRSQNPSASPPCSGFMDTPDDFLPIAVIVFFFLPCLLFIAEATPYRFWKSYPSSYCRKERKAGPVFLLPNLAISWPGGTPATRVARLILPSLGVLTSFEGLGMEPTTALPQPSILCYRLWLYLVV